MSMHARFHPTGGSLLERASSWLSAREAEHNLMLAVAAASRDEPGLWCTIERESGEIVGVATQTPPHNLLITALPPDAIDPLVDALRRGDHVLPGVSGPRDASHAFAERWLHGRGGTARVMFDQGIYELTSVVHPTRASGTVRVARPSDLPLVTEWFETFYRETLHQSGTKERIAREVATRVAAENAFLLEDAEGSIVSMAMIVGHTPNGARIGMVFTPVEQRARGHASTLVAAVSHIALDRGARSCFLYTDLANPTSNAIYQRLGYRPVAGAVMLTFGP